MTALIFVVIGFATLAVVLLTCMVLGLCAAASSSDAAIAEAMRPEIWSDENG